MDEDFFASGVVAASNRVADYLGSLIDSGRFDSGEIRLIENIADALENTLDPDSF